VLSTFVQVDAENYPFCTIDPTVSRVALPDPRFDWLVEKYKPASRVPAYLSVTDIAGLVRGAAEGEGLGNAFLSHILACDGIYHIVRGFKDEDIIHVDGSVDPIRDLQTIRQELLIKDTEFIKQKYDKVKVEAGRNGKDKQKQLEWDTMQRVMKCVEDGIDVRFGDW
jgi:obg-like ATPase 1